LFHQALGFGRFVPKIWLLGLGLEFFELALFTGEVKDAPAGVGFSPDWR
jgi:hypothetical protein